LGGSCPPGPSVSGGRRPSRFPGTAAHVLDCLRYECSPRQLGVREARRRAISDTTRSRSCARPVLCTMVPAVQDRTFFHEEELKIRSLSATADKTSSGSKHIPDLFVYCPRGKGDAFSARTVGRRRRYGWCWPGSPTSGDAVLGRRLTSIGGILVGLSGQCSTRVGFPGRTGRNHLRYWRPARESRALA